MSIHVCKCIHNGREEFHLRYPGLTSRQASDIADMINGGALDYYSKLKKEHQEKEQQEKEQQEKDTTMGDSLPAKEGAK